MIQERRLELILERGAEPCFRLTVPMTSLKVTGKNYDVGFSFAQFQEPQGNFFRISSKESFLDARSVMMRIQVQNS